MRSRIHVALALFICLALPLNAYAVQTRIYLTSASGQWTVPSDWNNAHNTIEAIGGGGGAGAGYATASGGGGAYAKVSNVTLTPGVALDYVVGQGGMWGGYAGDDRNEGGPSGMFTAGHTAWILLANGGSSAGGGRADNGIGDVRYSGGRNAATMNAPGAGGGGAGGPGGDGANGSINPNMNTGGAGGAGGGGAGGAGGVGATSGLGGDGGTGQEWDATHGSGGGGGGGGNYAGAGAAGLYGGGGGQGGSASAPTRGAPGIVVITYIPVPSCTITIDDNPLNYGSSTTLHYSSVNADTFYINSIGYVGASGSTSVGPAATTNYSGLVTDIYGATSSCPVTLTVTPPPAVSATISASSTSIQVGQSTGIHATFAAGSGDTLTHDNIDQPLGTGVGATTNPDAHKYYTFTPLSAGTYIFYARAQTSYFTSWTTYATTTVTVTEPPPTCDFSASPSSVIQGQTVTVEWECQHATSCTGTGFSTGGATEGSVAVTANSSTNYSISCTGVGGGTYEDVSADTVTVTCAPLYACSDDDITYTDASCETVTIDTCSAPSYCVAGESACQFGGIEFVEFDELPGGLTGHLQAQPAVIRSGDRTRLYWQVTGAESCAVSGGGQNWTGLTSGSAGVQTTVLTQLTRYTLTCESFSGVDDITETFDVLITPSFNEH